MSLLDALDENRSDEKGRLYGVAVGVVSNIKDEEGLGRVKVDLPWRGAEADESCWARVVTPMAGKGRGLFFLPEVGDEVLVAFDHGDIDHPYVLGGLWNGVDKPPETNADGKNNRRTIRSRSGHEIVFNDDGEQGQEKVEIRSRGGHRIVLDDTAGQEKIDIVDKTGTNHIVIDSAQKAVTVEAEMQLKITAPEVEIAGTKLLTMKSDGPVTVQGQIVKIN